MIPPGATPAGDPGICAEKTPSHEGGYGQRRTAVWFENTLVGDADYLSPLVEKSLEVSRTGEGAVARLEIQNHTDADYILENLSEYRLHNQA